MEVPNIDQQIKESFDEFSMFHSDNIDLINSNKDDDIQSVPLNDSHILKDLVFSEAAEKTKNIIFNESDDEIIKVEEFKSEADMNGFITTSQKAKEKLILQPCSPLASWVQCDQKHCQKWRLIENEPIPEENHKWECYMSKNSCRNKCEFSQETMPSDNDETFHTSFLPGDIVLGKMPGYPWWPGIIEDDPDFESFFDCQKKGDREVISFHVTFFGKEASRAWLQKTSIANFDGHEKLEDLGPLSYQGKSFRKKVLEALKEAMKALDMTEEKRLRKYSFMKRHKEENAKIRPKSRERKESITIQEVKMDVTNTEIMYPQEIQKSYDDQVNDINDSSTKNQFENTVIASAICEELTPSQEHAEKMVEKYVTAEMLLLFRSNSSIENNKMPKKMKAAPSKSNTKRKNQTNESVSSESNVNKKIKITKDFAVKKISGKKKLNEQNLNSSTGSGTKVINDEKSFIVRNDVFISNAKKKKKEEKQINNTQSGNEIKLNKIVGQKRKKNKTLNLLGKTLCESKVEHKLIPDIKKSSKVSCVEKAKIFPHVKKIKKVIKLENFEVIKESSDHAIGGKHSAQDGKPIIEDCTLEVPTIIQINLKPLLANEDIPNAKSVVPFDGKLSIKELSKSDPLKKTFKKKITETEKNDQGFSISRIQNTNKVVKIDSPVKNLTSPTNSVTSPINIITSPNNIITSPTNIVSPANSKIKCTSALVVSCPSHIKPTFVKKGIPSKKSVFKAPVKNEVGNLMPPKKIFSSINTKPLGCSSNLAFETLHDEAGNKSNSLVSNVENEGDVDIGLEMNLSLQLEEVSPILPSSSPEF